MNIIAACKIVPDDQDVKVGADGSLDFSKAHRVISAYDKNALEGAATLKGDGTVKVISVGGMKANDSKVKKDVLARGVDELYMTSDEACEGLDAFAAAAELAKLVRKIGEYDVIVVGDGSADLYAKQTGVQLAARLGVPYVSAVFEVAEAGGKIVAKRLLEQETESVEVPTPCVISIAPDFAEPRICGMKDILSAGKKPMNVAAADGAVVGATDEVSVKAPVQADRKCQIFSEVNELAAAVKAAL